MSYADVQSCVSAVVPCAHMAWPTGCAPSLPWAVFYLDETDPVGDNGAYAEKLSWVVEFYQRSRDAATEAALEAALRASFGALTKQESWVDSEGCLMTSYYFNQFEEVPNGD